MINARDNYQRTKRHLTAWQSIQKMAEYKQKEEGEEMRRSLSLGGFTNEYSRVLLNVMQEVDMARLILATSDVNNEESFYILGQELQTAQNQLQEIHLRFSSME